MRRAAACRAPFRACIMGHRLAPALSFCCADAQRIFLDTRRDRYFALSTELDQRFQSWTRGHVVGAEDLASLVRHGVLEEYSGPDEPPSPCPPADPARVSLFETGAANNRLGTGEAYMRFRWARLRLRLFGLEASLRALQAHKRQALSSGEQLARARVVGAAFRQAAKFTTTRHFCLPHALAVAHVLCARNAPGQFVIAVRARPFGAHAWVQLGDAVVNDSVDNVREFTPILVI